ncbi:MAG: hypothetical protein PHG27_05290 [Massilibacteroides sp.]|nr:hypothetical protein [Massilibacteroides sp.]MDD3062911.1 hypothetical protein [Massilibacteroides sp.]MDD4114999.1 hypothetical protein [Massilibacteroides sp.]MDD4660452.1 hypothetical protein [Massilibacteroides sp.]
MKKWIVGLLFFCMTSYCMGQNKNVFTEAVKLAVNRQMQTYPKSTLKDLYKNFFQDRYGPGHLIADTAAAAAYIRRELAAMERSDGLLLEEIGWEGRFYRVNLSLLKDGTIPYPVFFDAFVRSVNQLGLVPIPVWSKEWDEIERIIAGMNLNLPNFEKDRLEIEKRLSQGDYVGHHSELFEKTYAPHYRIIRKEIFEKELRPYLKR